MSVALCNYCGMAPTISKSHVVPRFLGAYIKKNSPFGRMLNLWERVPKYDLHKGPYLCARCDNSVFGAWETYYSQNVWPNPVGTRAAWSDVRTINFFLAIAYRYALHFLATSPIAANAAYSAYIRDLCKAGLGQSSTIAKTLFIYPYVHQPIRRGCDLLPGINHLLSLGVGAESLPREGDLPNAMLILVPKVLVLLCDDDIRKSSDCTMKKPACLSPGGSFDPSTQNTDMPAFLCSRLNRYIGQGQGHQKQLGLWKRLAYAADKMSNPWKMCYQANTHDQALHDWQKANCGSSRIRK